MESELMEFEGSGGYHQVSLMHVKAMGEERIRMAKALMVHANNKKLFHFIMSREAVDRLS